MNNYRFALNAIALFVISLAFTTAAQAQPQRTFVSAQQGDDANTANNCSVTQPCRNFDAAIGVVRAGGEVVALDSGGYGPVSITKAVTLTGPTGVYVAITGQTAGESAIAVSAAGTDTVVLRGLTLTGLGGQHGILVTSVGNLHVEGCVISGFTSNGIRFTTAGKLIVSDTVVRNCRIDGLLVVASTSVVKVTISGSRFENNGQDGIDFDQGNITASITDSILSGNTDDGLEAGSSTGVMRVQVSCTTADNNGANGFRLIGSLAHRMSIESSTASGNGSDGIEVDNAAAFVSVSNSAVSINSGVGFRNMAGTFESRGNNTVRHNQGSDTLGTITVITGT